MENLSEDNNGFIINLSNSKSTADLVNELSSLLELPEIKNKAICLKLGDLDLNSSQLLSIKALIESMESNIKSVLTTSDITITAAEYLNIKTVKTFDEDENTVDNSTSEDSQNAVAELNTLSQEEISEIIPLNLENKFEHLAQKEGLIEKDKLKYVPLETQDVIDEKLEELSQETKKLPTYYMTQTLRSGQTLNFDGNVVIIGDAHPGSEIIADGDITVWGVLGGIAHAGANGNVNAKIRALKLNAIQIRIASLYARRNDTVNIPFVQKTSEFTPEEARIDNKQIIIYKTIRRD